MKVVNPTQNCVFLIDNNENAHCFSYGYEVAAIIGDEYIEYSTPDAVKELFDGRKNPDVYNSPTTKRHKSMFRAHFDI